MAIDMTIFLAVFTAIIGFVAGWLARTESIRQIVFQHKFDTYLKLNSIATDILLSKLAAHHFQDKNQKEISQLGKNFSKVMISNALTISGPVYEICEQFVCPFPMTEKELGDAFNLLSIETSKELKLKNINRINKTLFSLLKDK